MKKLLSTVLIVCLALSAIACNNTKNEESTDTTDFTTRETEVQTKSTIDEPNQTIETVDPTATSATESTPAPAGKYTYTVYAGTEYETTLSMDVNIDDYLVEIKGLNSPYFDVRALLKGLGWFGNGDPNYDWSVIPSLYSSYVYNDAQMVWRYGDCYSSKDNPVGFEQLCSFMYHKAPLDNYEASANPSYSNNHSDYGIIVTFSQHPDDLCYSTCFPGSTAAISREDAIIIAYVLSSAISRPGENPFVGTNLEKAQWTNSDDYLSYQLP